MAIIKSFSLGVGTNLTPLRKGLSQARTEFASFGTSLPRITGYVDPAFRTANTIVSGFSAVKNTSSSAFSIAIKDKQYAHAAVERYFPFFISFVAFFGSKSSESNRPPIHSSIFSCSS